MRLKYFATPPHFCNWILKLVVWHGKKDDSQLDASVKLIYNDNLYAFNSTRYACSSARNTILRVWIKNKLGVWKVGKEYQESIKYLDSARLEKSHIHSVLKSELMDLDSCSHGVSILEVVWMKSDDQYLKIS